MVEQYLVTSWIKFLWLLLALQVKVGNVASFVVRASTMKTMNILPPPPGNYQLYTYQEFIRNSTQLHLITVVGVPSNLRHKHMLLYRNQICNE